MFEILLVRCLEKGGLTTELTCRAQPAQSLHRAVGVYSDLLAGMVALRATTADKPGVCYSRGWRLFLFDSLLSRQNQLQMFKRFTGHRLVPKMPSPAASGCDFLQAIRSGGCVLSSIFV